MKKTEVKPTPRTKKKTAPEPEPFYEPGLNEVNTNYVNIDVYQVQTMGQPTKKDKIVIPLEGFNIEEVREIILRKHGPGAYRLRRYNKKSGYSTTQLIIENTAENNINFVAPQKDPIIIQLEKMRTDMEQLKRTANLDSAKINKINAETEIYVQTQQLEIEIKKRELAKLDERSPIEKMIEGLIPHQEKLLKIFLEKFN